MIYNNDNIAEKIERMALKASLLIKARKMKLTNSQLNVYRKIVNNEVLAVREWRSLEALVKKDLIEKKTNRKHGECEYKTK